MNPNGDINTNITKWARCRLAGDVDAVSSNWNECRRDAINENIRPLEAIAAANREKAEKNREFLERAKRDGDKENERVYGNRVKHWNAAAGYATELLSAARREEERLRLEMINE
jgi:hypothetical protein